MVLKRTDYFDLSSGIVWQLVVALVVAWIFVFCLVVKGIEGTGKVVYVSSTFPFVALLILGIQGWTLDGAGLGLSYFLTPNVNKLMSICVWNEAASNKIKITFIFLDLDLRYILKTVKEVIFFN